MRIILKSPLVLCLAGILFTTKAFPQTVGTKSIGIDVAYRGYMSNYEYFNPVVSGYTLFGNVLEPSLSFRVDSTWSLYAGAWLQQDFGSHGFRRVEPNMHLAYRRNKLNFRFGNIDVHRHFLPASLYDKDNFITHGPAYGAQFFTTGHRVYSDSWIAWRRMIYSESIGQERIEAGSSWKINLLDSVSTSHIFIPLHAVVTHNGGQIGYIDSLQRVTTLYSVAGGLVVVQRFENSFVGSVGAEGLLALCNNEDLDALPTGKGLSTKAFATFRRGFALSAAWWVGDNFFSPIGTPLYQSRSSVYAKDTAYFNQRQLIFVTATWQRKWNNGLQIEAWVQPYYDVNLELMEYGYCLRLTFEFDAVLKRFD